MTRTQIIEQLFTGKNFNDCINKMEPDYLREDLKMEVALIVCEWSEEKIVGLHDRKELEFFVVRVILNQIQSSSSPFFKKFRQTSVDVVYEENRKEDFYTALEHYNRMPGKREHENTAVFTPSFIEEEGQTMDRQVREDMEDKALREIENLYWYNAELVKLYMLHGNYRAIELQTGIPFVSCYHTIRKSFKELKQKAL